MMKNYKTDDTFLGRWIAGELSEEELDAFKETEAYKQFKIINGESQLLDGPDIDTEKALKNVKQKINQKRSKQKTIKLFDNTDLLEIIEGDVMDLELLKEISNNKKYIFHGINYPYDQWAGNMTAATENIIEAASQNKATIIFPGNIFL